MKENYVIYTFGKKKNFVIEAWAGKWSLEAWVVTWTLLYDVVSYTSALFWALFLGGQCLLRWGCVDKQWGSVLSTRQKPVQKCGKQDEAEKEAK